jgi:hypothetical protein
MKPAFVNQRRYRGSLPVAIGSLFGVLWLTLQASLAPAAGRTDGKLQLRVVDAQTGQPLTGRMHLRNSRDRPVLPQQANVIEMGDFFYIDGQLDLKLRKGQYTFELNAGSEYRTRFGHFEIDRRADDTETIKMNRFANLADEGWYAADLLLGEIDAELLAEVLKAEQLHLAVFVDWSLGEDFSTAERRRRRLIDSVGSQGVRVGFRHQAVPGCLFFTRLDADQRPHLSDVPQALPTLAREMRAAHDAKTKVVAISPLVSRLPTLLATGGLDAIQVIGTRAVVKTHHVAERKIDSFRFSGERGAGRYAEQVYFQMLECGFRIPPVAGSGASKSAQVVPGASRVYVHCDDGFFDDDWWNGLSNGRVFVTNGPLLRPMVAGHPPGHIFQLRGEEVLELEIGLELASRESVDYLEIIRDGRVEYDVRLDKFVESGGRLPKLRFDQSGWFLLRVRTRNADFYQRALTAPYFVEKDGVARISGTAVRFFLDWVDAAGGSEETESASRDWARRFWQQRLETANVE